MALPPFEIRYKKSALYFVFGVLGFIFFGATFMTFFSGIGRGDTYMYVRYFTTVLVLALCGVLLSKRFKDPRPVLVFLSDGLLFPRKNELFIPWGSVTQWKIRRDKSNHRLIVHTDHGKTSIDITWLDISVKHIEELMARYIRQPGPGGFLR
jgi:hypothetical protein